MATRMLIDARHREETRVAVVTGNQIDEFDFESTDHKQIKGNIYLAKVTRVEPSLQAAFVDYGGNRHGFLAFSEIHPDYYQIPKEDRERLLADEAEAAAEEAALREQEEAEYDEPSDMVRGNGDDDDDDFVEVDSDDSVDTFDVNEGESGGSDDNAEDYDDQENGASDYQDNEDEDRGETGEDSSEEGSERDGRRNRRGRGKGRSQGRNQGRGRQGKAKASDEARAKRLNLRRRYKIQDVIHRRQVLLVQVVKEERGNKGAALTSYLSLAGRYCVLMPNTSHGGGISRKINSASDRKRLKTIISDLALPSTMGCIIRTAGLARTKPEIKRDFDYLARLWDEIRERTLQGAAPMLIHTDSDLIKRAIRDIYNKDIDEVLVEGPEGYKAAKDFMKLLMPTHAKRVQQYADPVPLFQRYHVEDQLNAMYQPIVQLKSGGYIVINPTEALVSIDINSGRSTKEHGIEATALSTNLEAAREIARQLRLRDMAGLVVIDFIDMENHSNGRKVERAMKDALRHDRARIQVGRISSFGLMEMSRQRLRTGVLEASTRQCPHCEGTGLVRTASSAALSALRIIEEEAATGNGSQIVLQASQEATIYLLNNKRTELAEIEARYHVRVIVIPNSEAEGAKLTVNSGGPKPARPAEFKPVIVEDDDDDILDDYEDEIEEEADERPASNRDREDRADGDGRKRKRRRGRRGGRNREREDGEQAGNDNATSQDNDDEDAERPAAAEEGDEQPRSKPRRSRRGGRNRGRDRDGGEEIAAVTEETATIEVEASEAEAKPKRKSRAKPKAVTAEEPVDVPVETAAEKPAEKAPSKSRAKPRATKSEAVVETATEPTEAEAEAPAKAAKPKTTRAKKPTKAEAAEAAAAGNDGEEGGAPRSGWWQRTFG